MLRTPESWVSNLLQKSERRKRKSPLSFVFMGTLALVIKVMPRKSQIKRMRINIGIFILSFLAPSMTYKKQMVYITFIFFPHILLLHLSAWLALLWFHWNCSFKGQQWEPAKFNLLFYFYPALHSMLHFCWLPPHSSGLL